VLCIACASLASAQELSFPNAIAGNDTARTMAALAQQAIGVYEDNDRDRYLDNLFRLQTVAGRYADATNTLTALRALRRNRVSPSATAADALFAILATAKQRGDSAHFDDAFRQAFREGIARLDDRTSALAIRALGISHFGLDRDVDRALAQRDAKDVISLSDAVRLIKAYQIQQAFRTIAPLAEPLVAADDERRYMIDRNIQVRTPDGGTVCAMVVRQRSVARRLPALLNFTIYADSESNLADARRAASNGYVGVIGLTRGKGCSPDQAVPYEHDGSDAAALIDWIARQSWSDGRVGMYGGSYEGFTQWATSRAGN